MHPDMQQLQPRYSKGFSHCRVGGVFLLAVGRALVGILQGRGGGGGGKTEPNLRTIKGANKNNDLTLALLSE